MDGVNVSTLENKSDLGKLQAANNISTERSYDLFKSHHGFLASK
jgi:hypothetical protein